MTNLFFDYNQYKKSLNLKKNYNFSILITTIILLLGLIVFINPKQRNILEFHFIEIETFQTYNQAVKLIDEMKKNGDLAYLYFDKNYHVILSFSINYEDAKNNLNIIKSTYPSSKILTLECHKKIQSSSLAEDQNSIINDIAFSIDKLLVFIDTFSKDIKENNDNFEKENHELNELKNDFNDSYNDFISQFNSNPKFNKAKEIAQNLSQSIEHLKISNEEDFFANIEYQSISIAISKYQFMSLF